ncbi:signal peptidase II, partial [Aeromonas sp. CPF2-S1]|nr:signal peptidase II [Aeromonas sp. CPF2-S1]
GWQRWFFAVLAFAICGLLIHWLRKQSVTQRWSGIAYSLIIGGALGNVFDRLVLGHVVDFLDFYWQRAHWPAFNLADSFIFIGAAMIVLDGFRGEKKQDATS